MLKDLLIVGAGDVVAKRMLPALLRLGIAERITVVHNGLSDIDATGCGATIIQVPNRSGEALEAIAEIAFQIAAPVIVATPPAPRLDIARRCRALGLPVVLEKPLFTSRDAEDFYYASLAGDRGVYALSYYVQEKALAWTCLYSEETKFERLVEVAGGTLGGARQFLQSFGAVEDIAILIREGAGRSGHLDRTAWYESESHGILFDLGVHVLSMMAIGLHIGPEPNLPSLRLNLAGAGQYHLTGNFGGADLRAEFGKYYRDEQCVRNLRAQYEKGHLHCEIDTGLTRLVHQSGQKMVLRLSHFGRPYETMVRLVVPFLEAGIRSPDCEDYLEAQLFALRCLIDLAPNRGHFQAC